MLVIRTDDHYDYVDDSLLDSLIKSKNIARFKRNTEWVTVGSYPMRVISRHKAVNGADRLAINDSIFVREYCRANKLAGPLQL
jgi:hypothetical protein